MAQITLNSTGVASDGALVLQSNGTTTAATVTTAQNVGIGTATPLSKLNVYTATTGGTVRISSNTDAVYGELIFSSNNATYEAYGASIASLGTGGIDGGQLTFKTGSGGVRAEKMRLDGSGNLGIGTSSPAYPLDVVGAATGGWTLNMRGRSADNIGYMRFSSNNGATNYAAIGTPAANTLAIDVNGAERARINSSGSLLVGATSDVTNGGMQIFPNYDGTGSTAFEVGHITGSSSGNRFGGFKYAGTLIGTITQNGTTAVAYNTTSDYRLKENVQPLSGALARVAALKPCTYTWKSAPDEIGEGFIAHELAEVCPQAVTGEKDAVDEDGNAKYQSVDTSFLVATLTAAIQEQQALITALTARITALESN